jgi:Flp pilus assembly protein TadB
MIISLFAVLGFLYIFGGISLYAIEKRKNIISRLMRHRDNYDYGSSNFINGRPGDPKNLNKKGILNNRGLISKINYWLQKNSISLGAREFMILIIIILSLVFTACLAFAINLMIPILISAVILLLIFIFIDLRGRKENLKKEDQLENFLLDLIGNLYANPNITLGIQKTLESAEYPLKRDFEIVIDDVRKGILLNDALRSMVKRNSSNIIEVVLTGLVVANEKGTDLIDFLKDQIDYTREKKSINNYIKILSSGPKYTSYIIMLIPVASIIIASLLNENFISSLLSGIGIAILIYAGISYFLGFLFINRIINLGEENKTFK